MRGIWIWARVMFLVLPGVACKALQAPPEPEPVDYWNGPCADEAVLLATTSGSPDQHACSNKRHRMHVQVATTASKEEVGALIFCECERAIPIDAGAPVPDAGSR